MRENRDGCALNFDAGAFGFAHLLRFLRDAERRGLQWYCVYLATNPTLLPPDKKQDLSIGGRIFRRFRRLAFHYCGSALSPTVDPDAATAGVFAALPRCGVRVGRGHPTLPVFGGLHDCLMDGASVCGFSRRIRWRGG
jgi:hypothetical protein